MKLEKPGPKIKRSKKVSRLFLKTIIERPEEPECKNCRIDTGTENYHHVESKRIKMLFGGGIMGKITGKGNRMVM